MSITQLLYEQKQKKNMKIHTEKILISYIILLCVVSDERG